MMRSKLDINNKSDKNNCFLACLKIILEYFQMRNAIIIKRTIKILNSKSIYRCLNTVFMSAIVQLIISFRNLTYFKMSLFKYCQKVFQFQLVFFGKLMIFPQLHAKSLQRMKQTPLVLCSRLKYWSLNRTDIKLQLAALHKLVMRLHYVLFAIIH